jgi:hypothetical protein
MMLTGNNPLNTRSTLTANSKSYAYHSLTKAPAAPGDVSRLPFPMKFLLENLPHSASANTGTRAA